MQSRSFLDRRELLGLCGLAGVSVLIGRDRISGEEMIHAERAVDHLLLGAADLEGAAAWLERKTGVKAQPGGSHPGVGTRNALVSLGARRYLEIIAPDPQQTAYNFQIEVRKLAEPRLITWAAATTDMDRIAAAAREAGYQPCGPRDGTRARPDGKVLRWKTLGVMNKLGAAGVEPIPFFIQWSSDSLHPSQDSPPGCNLRSFEIAHPDAASVGDSLRKLGIKARIRQAANAALTAVLDTPRGRVELS